MATRLFLFVTIACAAAFPQDRQAPKLASVQGRVVSATSAEPLRKASVTLSPGATRTSASPRIYSATTDASGNFEITNVPAGRYRFRARKNGYLQGNYKPDANSTAGTFLFLEDGQQIKNVLFRLTPAGAVVGRITDESGDPVSGVEVSALLKVNQSALSDEERTRIQGQLLPVGSAVTNDLGEYRIYGLPPGNFYISAIDSGLPELTEHQLRGGAFSFDQDDLAGAVHPPVYFPGVPSANEAQIVALKGGEEARADVVLRPSKAGTVSGRVLAQDGKPAQDVRVLLRPKEFASLFSSMQYTGTTDPQGKFAISNVADGAYIAEAWSQSDANAPRLTAHAPVQLTEHASVSVELRLSKGAEISGAIVAGSPLTFGQKFERSTMVWIRSVDDAEDAWGAGQVNKDGAFKVQGDLREGTYAVKVTNLPDGWYVNSISAGDQDVMSSGLKLTPASSMALRIGVVQGAAVLEGTVLVDGSPVGGARLRLQPETDAKFREDMRAESRTDQQGSFVIKNVVPGAYKVIADTADDEAILTGEEDVNQSRAETSVTLNTGERKRIQLSLPKPQGPPVGN